MSDKACPSEAELLAFADADSTPERLERVKQHLAQCGACAKQVAVLVQLIGDVAAPLGQSRFDVAEHVASVTRRLDVPVKSARDARRGARGGIVGVLAAAAAVAVFAQGRWSADRTSRLAGVPRSESTEPGNFEARGGAAEAGLARDIGVQLYRLDPSLRALARGDRLRANVALTAGLRNLGKAPVYVLLFAVDAKHAVHWIAPEFTTAGTDPQAMTLASSPGERLLSRSAAFDDLARGPLRVVALISSLPTHVSQIESLAPSELDGEGWVRRFPGADVREFVFEVVP